MPRNGLGVYSPPSGTTATSGQTIESDKYNAFVSDLASDANAARPIVAGGTGATTARGALANMGLGAIAVPETDISSMTASTTVAVGDIVAAMTGYNGEQELFSIVPAGTYTANGQEVITLTGVSGQAVSLRVWFKTVAELLADTRGDAAFATDAFIEANGYRYQKALSSVTGTKYLTTAGGAKFLPIATNGTISASAYGCAPSPIGALVNVTAELQAVTDAGFAEIVFEPGFYLVDKWTMRRGTRYWGRGMAPNLRIGATNATFDDLITDDNSPVFIFSGDDAVTVNIDNCTAGFQFGYDRTMSNATTGVEGWQDRHPTSAAPFTTFEMFDATNQDASGSTPATLRNLKAAVHIEDGWNRVIMHNIKIIPSCTDGTTTYGLSGYTDYSTVHLWKDYDIGVFARNTWGVTLRDCTIGGYWRDAGMLWWMPPADGFATVTPNSEAGIIDNCSIQSGVSFRSGDLYRVVDKTSVHVYLRWSKSHTFASTGSLWISSGDTFSDPTEYPYTAILYTTSATPGTGKTGAFLRIDIGSTTGVNVGDTIVMVPGQGGISHTKIRDSYISDVAHLMALDEASDEMAPRRTRYSTPLEISGAPARALKFDNVVFNSVSPRVAHIGAARDVTFTNDCYAESKSWRWSVGGALETARGGVFIAGASMRDDGDGAGMYQDDAGAAGSARLSFWQANPLNSTVSITPFADPRSSVRMSTMTDVFYPTEFRPDAYVRAVNMMGGLQNKILDTTDIGDASHPINLYGKDEGLMVFAKDTNKLYIALGSGATSVWADMEGTTNITPA